MARGKYFKIALLLTFEEKTKRSENSIADFNNKMDDKVVRFKPIPNMPNTIERLRR